MPLEELREQIEAWQREVDEIVGQDFTAERSARAEELDGLISRAWREIEASASPGSDSADSAGVSK